MIQPQSTLSYGSHPCVALPTGSELPARQSGWQRHRSEFDAIAAESHTSWA